MQLSGYLGATYGPINNSQNNTFLQDLLRDINAGNAYVSGVPQGSDADGNPIIQLALTNSTGHFLPWTGAAWASYTLWQYGPNQYKIYFADPGSEGWVTIYFVTDQFNGYGEKILPIIDPNKQVFWQGGPPGNAAYAPALMFLGAVLTAGFAAYAAAAANAVASTGAAAASTTGATAGAATDFSLIPGAGSGIGVSVPASIAAPVSSVAQVAGGSGLVSAGTVLPSIGAAAGSGVVIPASLTTPVTSLADVAGGQGLVAVSQGANVPLPASTGYQGIQVPQTPVSAPAVSSPIPSQQTTLDTLKNLPTNTVGNPGASPASALQSGATNQLLSTVAKQVGTVLAGGGVASGVLNKSPGYAVNPLTGASGGLLYPTATGAGGGVQYGSTAPGTGSLQGTLAALGSGGLLLGLGALYFLMRKKR